MSDRRTTGAEERGRLSKVYSRYTGDYATRWSLDNAGNRAIVTERDRLAREMLRVCGLDELRGGTVLDLGAGAGESFPGLIDDGTLVRADLLLERLERGRATDATALLVCADGSRLPFTDDRFDMAIVATVLSSVVDEESRRAIASDIWRTVRPAGALLVYDFRVGNPRNSDTHPIRRRATEKLLPVAPRSSRTLTVAPPVARRLGAATGRAYPMLTRLAFLRTHRLTLWVKR